MHDEREWEECTEDSGVAFCPGPDILDLAEIEDLISGITMPKASGPSSIEEQKADGSMISMSTGGSTSCSPGAGVHRLRSCEVKVEVREFKEFEDFKEFKGAEGARELLAEGAAILDLYAAREELTEL